MRTLSLISYNVSQQLAKFDESEKYTVHGLLWDYCLFISGEWNVLIATIFCLVIVVITVV